MLLFTLLIGSFASLSVSVAFNDTGNFREFCESEFLDSVDGPATLVDDKNCQQSFPHMRLNRESAAEYCQDKSPFFVVSAEMDDVHLKCHWNLTAECPSGSQFIYGKCYSLMKECEPGMTLASYYSGQAFRWLALFFREQEVVKMAVKNDTKSAGAYSRGVVYAKEADENSVRLIAVNRMPAFDIYPHQILHLLDLNEDDVLSVCVQPAFGETHTMPMQNGMGGICNARTESSGIGTQGGDRNLIDSHESAAMGCARMGASDDGIFNLFVTRNLYSPKLNKDKTVDYKYFHEVCHNFCEICTVAPFEYIKQHRAVFGSGRYYVAGGRTTPMEKTDNCTAGQLPLSERNDQWKLWVKKGHVIMINHTYWDEKHPTARCSDQGRHALAWHKGKLINVPTFARLPIICGIGNVPDPIPPTAKCYKNSELQVEGGKKKCKCKAGFVDVFSTEVNSDEMVASAHAVSLGFNPKVDIDYVCVSKSCQQTTETNDTKYGAIIFVVDGSRSIGSESFAMMRDFIYKAGSWLPKRIPIMIMQYSSEFLLSEVEPGKDGWNGSVYADAAHKAVGQYLGGNTPTYSAISYALEKYAAKKIAKPALMILLTGGQPDDRSEYRNLAMNAIRKSNTDLKTIPVGLDPEYALSAFQDDVKNPTTDIIPMEDYENLKNSLKENIEMTICKVTLEMVQEAAKPAE